MGTIYTYLLDVKNTHPPSMTEFANEHSTSGQRAFNLLCMAYGADPELFHDLPALGGLPQQRAEFCGEEYELISLAFQALIAPHIDQDLAKKVFDKSWLPEENSKMLSPRP